MAGGEPMPEPDTSQPIVIPNWVKDRPMADNREIAEKVLQTALGVVMNQRQNVHGGAENSFAVIGAYWKTYLDSKGKGLAPEITAYDVAQMMTLLKIARASMGKADHADHYIDAAGYNALAAMLADAKVD